VTTRHEANSLKLAQHWNKKLSYRWQTARCICAACNGAVNTLKHVPAHTACTTAPTSVIL